MDKMNYTLTVSRKQLEIMEDALHSYARLLVGQLTTAVEPITFRYPIAEKLNKTQRDWLGELTIHEHNQMHGHTEEGNIAWDIYQVLRHQIWKENPDRRSCVSDSVHKTGTEELVDIKTDVFRKGEIT